MKRFLLLILFMTLSLTCYSQKEETRTQEEIDAQKIYDDAKSKERASQLLIEAEKLKKEVEKNRTKSEKERMKTEKAKYKADIVNADDNIGVDETKNYFANVLTTNFSVPLARFNFTKSVPVDATNPEPQTKNGEITLFNSIGAGISYNYGVYRATTNGQREVVNEEFSNIIGAQIGFLFSAGTGEDTKNVFAPVVNLVILDFQVGLGYELGTVNTNQKRTFLTLSYAIPLYKLSKTGFYMLKKKPAASKQTNGFLKG